MHRAVVYITMAGFIAVYMYLIASNQLLGLRFQPQPLTHPSCTLGHAYGLFDNSIGNEAGGYKALDTLRYVPELHIPAEICNHFLQKYLRNILPEVILSYTYTSA